MIDLRSDTVTVPTPAMRQAMADAPVGDDVFREDPTVNELERATADLLGKEAALFVPSGTMANQLAIRLQTTTGDEIVVETLAHLANHEAGAPAVLSGVTTRQIPGRRGIYTAADLLANLRPPDTHHTPAKLVCVENTHNEGAGAVWPLETLAQLATAARSRGLLVHMDGARLWNAAAASGVSEAQFASHCDTVNVCFSKGLGAPVGSALVGRTELVSRARRFRKMWGGGMRQAGIIAAGALYALRNHRKRLVEDHANARRLADGLAAMPGVELIGAPVETNIVRWRVPGKNAAEIVVALKDRGVLVFATGAESLRAVTHLQVSSSGIDKALDAFRQMLHTI
jgi:threonine aldolase